MTQKYQSKQQKTVKQPDKLSNTQISVPASANKQKNEENHEFLQQYDSQFMQPPMLKQSTNQNKQQKNKQNPKSIVISKQQVEIALKQIYQYYSKSYWQKRQLTTLQDNSINKLKMQQYLLFCKNFNILKNIFSLDRLTLLFKKHADYGKYLSFDNFYFLINTLAHQPQTKKYFNLEQMTKNLDIQTVQELQKQQFYNYLRLAHSGQYKKNLKTLFNPFDMHAEPRIQQNKKYQYRKFSLPQLIKKALPQNKQKKKHQKDLFIFKHDKQLQQNLFDQAKSIVVSWDSLRSNSITNLGNPAALVEKKFLLKSDPEDESYIRLDKKNINKKQQISKKKSSVNLLMKIKQIQEDEKDKNNKILKRIDEKSKIKQKKSHKQSMINLI